MNTIRQIIPAPHYRELAEVRRLTAVVTPASAPWLLLPLFAGARGSETDELLGASGSPDLFSPHMQVPLHSRSGQMWRLVPMCSALAAWLAPYQEFVGTPWSGRNAERLLRRQLAAQGLRFARGEWRATYATYRVALTRNLDMVGMELGIHQVVPRTLFQPVTSLEAEEFFSLTPAACGRPQWAAEAAAWIASLPRRV